MTKEVITVYSKIDVETCGSKDLQKKKERATASLYNPNAFPVKASLC